MDHESKKPKYRPVPPVSGQWKKGQSGNPAGRPKRKPFLESLNRVMAALDPNGDGDAALDRLNAAMYARAAQGDVASYKELRDMVDGKIPQVNAIGGAEDLPAIKAIAWMDTLSVDLDAIEHKPEPAALEGSTTDAAPRDDDGTAGPKDEDPS